MDRETALWSIQKKQWILGPKLPKNLFESEKAHMMCFVAINRYEIFAFNMYTGGKIFYYNIKKKSERWLKSETPIVWKHVTSCMVHHTKAYQK